MPATFDEMVQNFRFYVQDRQLGLAEILGKHFEDKDDKTPFKQSGYVILSIASAYFEMIQQFIDGETSEGKSRDFFKRGFNEVYSDSPWMDDEILKIYGIIRCGMYHGGMPKINCHLSRYFKPGFHLCGNEIHVNPAAVVRELRQHFDRYIESLQTDTNRRVNFVTMCNVTGLDLTTPDGTHCATPGGTVFVPTTPAPGAIGNEPINWEVETEK